MKQISLLILSIFLTAIASAEPIPQVSVQVAKLKKVAKTLLFPALVKSRIESNITADQDLIVIRPLVKLGQKVNKGERLLELRNQDTSVNYHNKIIHSQVAGTVAAILVDQGQYITKGQELIKINDPEMLYLKMEAPVAHFKDIRNGLKGKVQSALTGGKEFEAQVIGVGAVTDAISGTIPVELSITSGQNDFLPGTIMNVELMLSEREVLLVPERALYYSADKTFIPLLKEGRVQKVEIKIGGRSKGEVEILQGVKLEETMIVGAGEFLKDGDKVDLVKQ